MEKKLALTNKLAREIQEQLNLCSILKIISASYDLFSKIKGDLSILSMRERNGVSTSDKCLIGDPFYELEKITESFDYIIGNLPLGLKKAKWSDKEKNIIITERMNWLVLFKTLFLLKPEGYGLYVVEPIFFEKKDFMNKLAGEGFFVNACFRTPERILCPHTSLRPNIILISKRKTEKLFIADLYEDVNLREIINNFVSRKRDTHNLLRGVWIQPEQFRDFNSYAISLELKMMLEQYKEFSKYELKEVAQEIRLNKELTEKENSVYIPRIGSSKVICSLTEAKLKHRNYFQIVLDNKKVKAKYLISFFNSDVGRRILDTLLSGSVIRHINKSSLGNCEIPLPSLQTQNKVIEVNDNVKTLRTQVEGFEKEISLNPKTAFKISDQIDSLICSLVSLNLSDRILSMIRKGENKIVEFKSTLRINLHTNKPDKGIEKVALKTIAAFLNTKGGTLLVGVNDEGKVLGTSKDNFRSDDDYLKHFRNLFKERVGLEFSNLVDYELVPMDDKKIFYVSCQRSPRPVYFGKEGEFYIRTNPATDKLTGRKMLEYVNEHFDGIIR